MKATPEDHVAKSMDKRSSSLTWIALLAIAGLVGLVVYFVIPERSLETPVVPPSPEPIVEETPPPVVPHVELKQETPEFVIPPLDESDSEIRNHLIEMSSNLAPWLQFEEIIRRGVTFNDALSRGVILNKLLSLPPPNGKFVPTETEDGLFLDESNYQRYEAFTDIVKAVDPDKLVDIFHLFRPLFEKAFGELGYNQADFGTSVIYSLDQILAAPVIEGPIRLTHVKVQYQFDDPALESLTPLQKQLIRMGPETTKLLQSKAAVIKARLLNLESTEAN